MENVVKFRNFAIRTLYVNVLKPLFFLRDPEFVHDRMTSVGHLLGAFGLGRVITRLCFGYTHPSLEQNILGISFKNPVGLAAGFDKDAQLVDIIGSVGFGHEELGSITGEPCAGNPKPRLWRLVKSKGLVVWYGLKNKGAEVVAGRLKDKTFHLPIGTSVAMTNCSDNLDTEHAISDYAKAFKAFTKIGAYMTVNISCPNTQGGQPFMDAYKLDMLLQKLDSIETTKPVFLKLSPDMSFGEIDALLDVAKRHRVHGLICSNLTKKHRDGLADENVTEKGGISGKPVQKYADELLAYIYKREGNRFVLVGVGGIFSAADAYAKIKAGASLLQMITGMIFEGPQVVSSINLGLVELMRRDGYSNISQVVGSLHGKKV